MNVRLWHDPAETRLSLWSWALSLLLHGAAVGASLALVADLRLAPQSDPFKWEVSLVQAPAAESGESPALAELMPDPPTLASAEPHPVEIEPVTQPVPTVRPVRQVARQQEVKHEVQAVWPDLQAAAAQQPQVISQAVQAAIAPIQTSATATVEPLSTPEALPAIREILPSSEPSPVAEEPVMPATQPQIADVRPSATAEPKVESHPAVRAGQIPATVQDRQVTNDAQDQAVTPAAVDQVVAKAYSPQSTPSPKADYGWLAEALWGRVEQLKRYPYQARMNRWEGRVVLRVVVREDGQIIDPTVAESSGHSLLDHDALEILRQASPLKLTHPLGKPQVVVQVPISYRLAH